MLFFVIVVPVEFGLCIIHELKQSAKNNFNFKMQNRK